MHIFVWETVVCVEQNVQHFCYCSFSGQAWNGILHWFGVLVRQAPHYIYGATHAEQFGGLFTCGRVLCDIMYVIWMGSYWKAKNKVIMDDITGVFSREKKNLIWGCIWSPLVNSLVWTLFDIDTKLVDLHWSVLFYWVIFKCVVLACTLCMSPV